MGCSCGYNVHIKTLDHSLLSFLEIPLPYVTKPVRSNFATVVLLPFFSFFPPPLVHLYITTQFISEWHVFLHHLCENQTFFFFLQHHSSTTTQVLQLPYSVHQKTIHPHLCNQHNKNKPLATQTQSHHSASE